MIAQAVMINWQEFGLAGVVIVTLCSGIGFLYRDMRKRETDAVERFYKERAEYLSTHHNEREGWRKDIGEQNKNVNHVVNELTLAVKDQVRFNEAIHRTHERNSRHLQKIANHIEIELDKESDDDIRA